jgi:hypothetical protein
MEQPAEREIAAVEEPQRKRTINKRWWIAIPMAIVFIAIGAAVYMPGIMLGGMMTDSCSGDAPAYRLWQIWLIFLWPVVMLAGALTPPILLVKNRRWKWVLISIVACFILSVMWWILWLPILSIFGGC